MNHIFNKYALIIFTLGFTMMMTSQPGRAQVPEQSDDDLLVFAASHPTRQEIALQILIVLENNIEKAKIIDEEKNIIARSQEIQPFIAGQFNIVLGEYYFHQKQLELAQWKFKIAQDDTTREIAAKNLSEIYDLHVTSVITLLQTAKKCGIKVGYMVFIITAMKPCLIRLP